MTKVFQSEFFVDWLANLRDSQAKRVIERRIVRVELGLLGDSKSLGEGLHELRIDFAAGYRIYYIWEDREIIFLLAGGDKSAQNRDITRARQLAAIHRNLH